MAITIREVTEEIYFDRNLEYYPGYKPMKAITVWELHRQMSKSGILVLDMLTYHMNSDNIFFGTLSDMTKLSGVGKKYLIEALKLLTKQNAIKRIKGAIMVNPSIAITGKFEDIKRLQKAFEKFGEIDNEANIIWEHNNSKI